MTPGLAAKALGWFCAFLFLAASVSANDPGGGAAGVGANVTLATTVTKSMGCDDRTPYVYQWSIISLPAGSKAAFLPASG